MATFDQYSEYYDLLYREKDYQAEALYIHEMIRKAHPNAHNLLELGCGTAKHAALLAERGYRITGLDRSETMLEAARNRIRGNEAIDLRQGDVSSFQLNKTFDVIISLFHVFSYLVETESLLSAFRCVEKHLNPNGIFIFDFWYGPGVMSDPPSVRVKRAENERIKIWRLAEPVVETGANIVEVNYEVLVQDVGSHKVEIIREQHLMRYLFLPEIAHLLASAGLKLVDSFEWMTSMPLSNKSWNAVVIVQKI